jgi:hypothetical protein
MSAASRKSCQRSAATRNDANSTAIAATNQPQLAPEIRLPTVWKSICVATTARSPALTRSLIQKEPASRRRVSKLNRTIPRRVDRSAGLVNRPPRYRARSQRDTALDSRGGAVLDGEQLARFLAASEARRTLFELLAYTGLHIGEALGLPWAGIDHDHGLIRVTRKRVHGPLKTPAGSREVVLAPAIAKQPREQWLASSFKAPHNLVWCNTVGRGLDYRDVGEDFRTTLKTQRHHRQRAPIAALAPPRLRLAADRQRAERCLRLPPTRPRQPEHHARGLRAPVRTCRPRRRRTRRARRQLHGDHEGGGMARQGG